ncbi:delta(14)-sterol reductase [Denticeps clupeoides]|uniref:Delta(14)-sterol reductase TM7SF2 n=1 Tax=Denticeps clupeoides TaxID=299321 RepID=A0AAY4DTU1_9TELE|nr:delta(14)-sterol reductase-like [Denticeps clupeoides]
MQIKQVNGHHRGKNEEDGDNRSQPHEEENQSVTRLLGVSLMMSPVLLVLYEGCRPPSEPWRLLGRAEAPLWDWNSLLIVVIYTALQAALYHLPLGYVAEGKLGKDGKRLTYNCNGIHAFLLSAALLVGMWYCGVFKAHSVTDRANSVVSACSLVAFVLAALLYVSSQEVFLRQKDNGSKFGNLVRKFTLGKMTDPRACNIDLKQFFMVRIGFIGWAMVDICYLLENTEEDVLPSLPLLLVSVFQLIYILDFLVDEETVLPTKEFTDEGIGFLMIQGEYVWIPFYSSTPAFFLLQRPAQISIYAATLLTLLFGVGFIFYHHSNEQKDGFRKNPNDPAFAKLETIQSPSGQKLLVSSWFGWVRHPNYLGDIMMNLAWSLPCGFTSIVPYLPCLVCINLLRRRATEIEESCQRKHGKAWEEYCHRVPYKMLPHVY